MLYIPERGQESLAKPRMTAIRQRHSNMSARAFGDEAPRMTSCLPILILVLLQSNFPSFGRFTRVHVAIAFVA